MIKLGIFYKHKAQTLPRELGPWNVWICYSKRNEIWSIVYFNGTHT